MSEKNPPPYLLETIVFVSGAVVMILELTGSRILAPHLGGSLPVWTALIGIILGSLSLGYYLGGRLADNNPHYTRLSMILLAASLSLGVLPILSKLLLPVVGSASVDVRQSAVLASVFLFALPSTLLGMISPYALRLKLESIQTSGATAGGLYAISTIGSIFGTFFAGFLLFAFLGSQTILYLLSGIMLLLAGITTTRHMRKKFLLVISFLFLLGLSDFSSQKLFSQPLVDTDTLYNRVIIADMVGNSTQRPFREMILNKERSSAIYLDGDDIVYDYVKYFRLADHFVPQLQTALMIGGAGYTYPTYFIKEHPQAKLDVVEIDPELTELAKQYFDFKPNQNTTIYHEDARTFLNREEKTYDVIFSDAFSAYYTHPFQLATQEAIKHMYNMLTTDGIVISNTVSAITEEKGKFLRSQYYTYKSVFPYVYIVPVQIADGAVPQNVMVVASKKSLDFQTQNPTYRELLAKQWYNDIPKDVPVLTDDYAPVEYYTLSFFE